MRHGETDLFERSEPAALSPLPPSACSADLEWRQRYNAHLKSAQWKNTRRDLFRLRGRKCEVCGKPSLSLEVHHLNYDRLGKEAPSDLQIVCKPCHEEADRKRERKMANERESRRISNAFHTWFEKKTGYDSWYATEADYDEFDEWLERKDSEYY